MLAPARICAASDTHKRTSAGYSNADLVVVWWVIEQSELDLYLFFPWAKYLVLPQPH